MPGTVSTVSTPSQLAICKVLASAAFPFSRTPLLGDDSGRSQPSPQPTLVSSMPISVACRRIAVMSASVASTDTGPLSPTQISNASNPTLLASDNACAAGMSPGNAHWLIAAFIADLLQVIANGMHRKTDYKGYREEMERELLTPLRHVSVSRRRGRWRPAQHKGGSASRRCVTSGSSRATAPALSRRAR